uniref:Mutator family transposase n=20 Tax=Staphylococcus aureus TaxID=1280 RepID=A0AAE6EXJ3_STAAU
MDIVNIVIMLLIGVFGGFISGLVGVGGAIIIYPAILLLPPLFGAPAYSAYIASGLTSSQVFFSTLSGSLKARKKTEFSPQLVLYMGGGMIIGSMLGAFLANLFDATFVNTVYIIIALLALTLMFIKVKPSSEKSSFNKYLLVIIGLFIGIISGIVGAGGAFIIIPILLVQSGESEETWTTFFEYLKERGLQGTELVISDAHKGLVSAIRKSFTNVSWQRCQVHFLRNIFTTIPKKNSKSFREAVKGIFKFTDINLAREAKNRLIHDYIDQPKYSKACASLDDGFEDAFQYTVQGNSHNRLKSTNLIERLNQEVRRREKIIRIFPNQTSANRLIGAVLMDLHDEWIYSSRKYINFDK